MDSIPIVFTLEELWMLNDFVRHDEERGEEKVKYPNVSTKLNEGIALAIYSCETYGHKDYTLNLDYAEILVIDNHIRRDMKTKGGANGQEILMKVYKARSEFSAGYITDWPVNQIQEDVSYEEAKKVKEEEVKKNAKPKSKPKPNASTNKGSRRRTKRQPKSGPGA